MHTQTHTNRHPFNRQTHAHTHTPLPQRETHTHTEMPPSHTETPLQRDTYTDSPCNTYTSPHRETYTETHKQTHIHTLTGWAPKLPALEARPTSWGRGNTILQRLSTPTFIPAVKSKAVPNTPRPAPLEMCAMWSPRAQPQKTRADRLSSRARYAQGTPWGLPAVPGGNEGPHAFASHAEDPAGYLSSQSASAGPHPSPSAWSPPQAPRWVALAWGVLGASPVVLSITRNPDLPSRRDPRMAANTSPQGHDASANVHPACSALLMRHAFFRAFTVTLRDRSQDSEFLFLN